MSEIAVAATISALIAYLRYCQHVRHLWQTAQWAVFDHILKRDLSVSEWRALMPKLRELDERYKKFLGPLPYPLATRVLIFLHESQKREGQIAEGRPMYDESDFLS